MQATDFEYDGTVLSDYGYIVCKFENNNGLVTSSIGADIKFDKIAHRSGKRFSLSSSKYEDCISIEFDICKDSDVVDDRFITEEEFRWFAKWLNRRNFCKLEFFDRMENKEFGCYYNASFNIEKITIAGRICGVRVIANTDSPFAYGNEYVVKNSVSAGEYVVVRNISDDIGFVSPNIKITCKSSGTLNITNARTNESMIIKNCAVGEEIIVDCEMQTIVSNRNGHDVANDFNYTFLSIENDRYDTENDLMVSLDCDIEISYSPIVKFVP